MRDAERYEKIFSGTKPVADNLKIDLLKLQPWTITIKRKKNKSL